MNISKLTLLFSLACLFGKPSFGQHHENFQKENIMAWCIVPFDNQHRDAKQRSQMLNELGIKKFAYDWRDQHIPKFKDELVALQKNDIELTAFWMITSLDPVNDPYVQQVFEFIEQNNVQTQLWVFFTNLNGIDSLSQSEKIKKLAEPLRYISNRAERLGCKVAMYNHGGWYGEPENQLAIIDYLQLPNLGIVYNFHHARFHLERFPTFYPRIVPHLYALNLAGLKKGDQTNFYRIGEGNAEKKMIKMVLESDYEGPIGIIGHNEKEDAKHSLQTEMAGLKQLLNELGENKLAETY